MELFHQTVSMKAVDNLNDFVRSHMLEPFDTKAQIDSLIEHFDNLTRAHDAVVRARTQLELLEPIVADLGFYDQLSSDRDAIERQQQALPFYFADRTRQVLDRELEGLAVRLIELDLELDVGGIRHPPAPRHGRAAEPTDRRSVEGTAWRRSRRRSNASRVPSPPRQSKFARFNDLLDEVGMERVSVLEQFVATRERAAARRTTLGEELVASRTS